MITSYAGLLLRAAREQAGVKMQEMAQATGNYQRDLSRIERGARGCQVTPEVVKAYEQVLETPLADAIARLTNAGHNGCPAPAPAPTPVCPLAAADALEPVAEPLRRLAETLHLLAWELRFLRGDSRNTITSNGTVSIHERV